MRGQRDNINNFLDNNITKKTYILPKMYSTYILPKMYSL